MNGFLAQMAVSSRGRARAAATREPLASLQVRASETSPPPALALANSFELIAEYKRSSPALGRLAQGGESLARRVADYARGGAVAVSVLTEPARFDGCLEDLAEAVAVLSPLRIPVLRKDFLVDPYQVFESRATGAGGVLLIARMLSDRLLGEMLDCALQLSLFVLLEAFDAADIERIQAVIRACTATGDPAPVLVGVNSRDLQTLEVSPYRFRELAPLLPPGFPHVAESGISTPEHCVEIARTGYSVALVGSSLMRESSPLPAIRAMLRAGRTAAGIAA
jgi:indole-3-glycerol phosphate synthase